MNGIECCFTGRLAADPEEKVSGKGALWCSFRVAADGTLIRARSPAARVADIRPGETSMAIDTDSATSSTTRTSSKPAPAWRPRSQRWPASSACTMRPPRTLPLG